MGLGFGKIMTLERHGALRDGHICWLDIGTQLLKRVPTRQLRDFLEKYGRPEIGDVDELANDLAKRSVDQVSRNEKLWLGRLLSYTPVEYTAFDIFRDRYTTVFDLNHDALPPAMVGRFDVVLNGGTTEHVFNQYNAFKVIHEALKVGGTVLHNVPAIGMIGHGFYNYSTKLFGGLAEANGYEILMMGYYSPKEIKSFAECCDLSWVSEQQRNKLLPNLNTATRTNRGRGSLSA